VCLAIDSRRLLEHCFETKLNVSRIVSRVVNGTQVAAIYAGADVAASITPAAIDWTIEHVQKFPAELHPKALGSEVFGDGEVPVLGGPFAKRAVVLRGLPNVNGAASSYAAPLIHWLVVWLAGLELPTRFGISGPGNPYALSGFPK
jgi:hypothetical protein